MPDPTEFVIIATFCSAFGIFAVTAGARKFLRKNQPIPALVLPVAPAEMVVLPAVEPVALPADSPYGTPASDMLLPPPIPVGRVPVWFYRPYDLFGIAGIFAIFFYLVVGSLHSQKGDAAGDLNTTTLIASIVLQFVLAGIVSALVIWRVRPSEWLGLKWRGWRWIFLIAPLAVGGMWLLFGTLQASGFMRWIESLGVETVQDTVKILQDSTSPVVLALMSVAAVLVAPLCEEIVFRGYLYSASKRFTGPWVAGICSGLVFAAAHGSIAALLPLFIFGCVLAFVYEKTGSLWAPCGIHFCFNAATVIIQMAGRYYHLPVDGGT